MLKVLLHIGTVIKIVHDIEKIIQNLVQKKESFPSREELAGLVEGLSVLIASGVIEIPQVTQADLQTIVSGLKQALVA